MSSGRTSAARNAAQASASGVENWSKATWCSLRCVCVGSSAATLDHGEECFRGGRPLAHRAPVAPEEQHGGGLGGVVAELGVPRAAGGLEAAPRVVQGRGDDGRREGATGLQDGDEVAGRFGDGAARLGSRRRDGLRGGGIADQVEQGLRGVLRGHGLLGVLTTAVAWRPPRRGDRRPAGQAR